MYHIVRCRIELLSFVAILLLISGCRIYVPTPVPTSEGGFTAKDLLLDASAFPAGWGAEPPFEIPGPIVGEAKEWERVARTFYGYSTIADQSVYGYKDKAEASEAFRRWVDRSFSSSEFVSVWETPTELQFQSSYTDQFHLACAQTTSNYVCQALGQYGEYVIRLYVPMQPRTNVTYADFSRILQTLEEHVAFHLQLELHWP
jgi:hypothetical protein